MTGAELIIKTAVAAGVDVCFANPGTTELPIVAALDTIDGIRAILGLSEGCCAGAADGYGRMKGKPALNVLHLGPGLANALANLHNARRAQTPILNIIGEHATWHRPTDPPLTMDIEALAATVCSWQRTSQDSDSLSRDTSDAMSAALQGQVVSLIVAHDIQWQQARSPSIRLPERDRNPFDPCSVEVVGTELRRRDNAALILGGAALSRQGLLAAKRIQAATGCDLLCETFPARMERGGDLPAVRRIPYFPKRAVKLLSSYQTLVLSGASEPVAFFGYKDQPSRLLSEEQAVFRLAVENVSLPQALDMLADSLQASAAKPSAAVTASDHKPTKPPTGALDTQKVCSILAGQQPENAIVVDESISSGGAYFALAGNAPPHSLLTLTGGAIGFGLPCATGAAIACSDRPVIDLQADGSAMYTIQSLWMQAREGLNVTTLIFSNRRYKILEIETARSGLGSAGKNAQALFDLQNPRMDWVQISHGMGVPAVQVDTCEMLVHEFRQAIAEAGPHLIEMLI